MEQATVFIQEGTTLADTAWTCTTNGPITIGTTATTWAQFGAGTAYIAGNGLTLTTATFDVVAADASLVVAADSITRGALTGDVTAPQGSNATTIAALAVTNAKLAKMTPTRSRATTPARPRRRSTSLWPRCGRCWRCR